MIPASRILGERAGAEGPERTGVQGFDEPVHRFPPAPEVLRPGHELLAVPAHPALERVRMRVHESRHEREAREPHRGLEVRSTDSFDPTGSINRDPDSRGSNRAPVQVSAASTTLVTLIRSLRTSDPPRERG